MGLMDLLFPKKCVNCRRIGDYVCASCFANLSFDVRLICVVCNKNTFDGLTHPACRKQFTLDGVFSGVVFNRVVRKLLYAFKYQPYVSDLGSFMGDLLYESLIQQELFMQTMSQTQPVVIPIPLSKERLRKRGYNHAKILADNLAKKFDLKVIDSLQRVKETRPQFGLKREERMANMKNAFTLKSYVQLKKIQTVFLADDVLTSGSTLSEAARILKEAGIEKVWGVTFAREQNFTK